MGENRPNLDHLSAEQQKKLRKLDLLYTGSAILGLYVAATYGCQKGCEILDVPVVYEGTIGGVTVVYDEKEPAEFPDYENSKQNIMVLDFKEKKQIYILYDTQNETSIDWEARQKPNFESDELEVIVIKEGDGTRKQFFAADIDLKTAEGLKTQEMFDVMNFFYNSLRSHIRELKRKDKLII